MRTRIGDNMQLNFEIKNKILRRKDTNVLIDDYTDGVFCKFNFITKEWKHQEKYIVFWDSKNKTTIKSLGRKQECECKIPQQILKENIFAIQIYANKELATQKLKVATIPPGYTIEKEKNNPCLKKDKKSCKDEYNSKKIFRKIFTELESKIDKIDYKNGYLTCYAGDKLIYSTPVFKNFSVDIQNEIKDLMPYFEVEENGDIYIIYPYDDVRHLKE